MGICEKHKKTRCSMLCPVCLIEDRGYLQAKLKKQAGEIRRLKKLLRRHKESMEPFPIVSDLRSMTQLLRQKHSEKETKVIKQLYKRRKEKFGKLYRDTEQACKARSEE